METLLNELVCDTHQIRRVIREVLHASGVQLGLWLPLPPGHDLFFQPGPAGSSHRWISGPGGKEVLRLVLEHPMVQEIEPALLESAFQPRPGLAGFLPHLAISGLQEEFAALDSSTCHEPVPAAVASIRQIASFEQQNA
nr:hypothetical protein [uncultured Arthrobacter sp.]